MRVTHGSSGCLHHRPKMENYPLICSAVPPGPTDNLDGTGHQQPFLPTTLFLPTPTTASLSDDIHRRIGSTVHNFPAPMAVVAAAAAAAAAAAVTD